MISAYNQTGTNTIYYGGGSSITNAITQHVFYTAANTTTLTGTERLRINNLGEVTIGTGNAGTSMSEFGSNTGGLTIDDVGVSNTGLRLSHGSDDTYLVQSSNGNFYMSAYTCLLYTSPSPRDS